MKLSKYLAYFLRDFLVVCGGLMVIAALLFNGTINTSPMWQIVIIALSLTFYKFALVNMYELSKKARRYSFYICFIMASLMIIVWLWFFSPNADKTLLLLYTVIIIVVKIVVYVMMQIDGNKQAKLLNDKLNQYKNDNSK